MTGAQTESQKAHILDGIHPQQSVIRRGKIARRDGKCNGCWANICPELFQDDDSGVKGFARWVGPPTRRVFITERIK